MQISINISNGDESVLNAIKSVLKMRPELDFKIKKNDYETEILKEMKETKKGIKNGTIRVFNSAKEYRQAVENGEI